MNHTIIKWLIGLCCILVIVAFFLLGGGEILSLEMLQMHIEQIQDMYVRTPALFILIFAVAFILTIVFMLPIATLFTLAAGAIFPLPLAITIVSLTSTLGATLVGITVRYLGGGFFLRGGETTRTIQKNIQENSIIYLLILRLLPIFPFFLINVATGLTPIRVRILFLVNLVGMLPGTAIYVYLGRELTSIRSVDDLLSIELFILLIVLASLPPLGKVALRYFNTNN